MEHGICFGAAFDRAKSQWMISTNKPLKKPLPKITLGDVTLTPQQLTKWLGVTIDPKLFFTHHVNFEISKGAAVANHLA